MAPSANDGPSGFAIVDKAAGWTSHDVVARARKLLDTRKVGHSGTLDPSATGVLVLGVGRGTKLLRFVTELPKTYVASFQLGVETDTLDADGVITARYDMAGVSLHEVRAAALSFRGAIEQIPPMVSAVKVDGRRLHELAREGKEVERKPRQVTVHQLEIDATDAEDTFTMTVRCSSGTYVRTLAADIGTHLGGGAHVRSLRRTAVGPFTQERATALEEISLMPLVAGMEGRSLVTVDGELEAAIRYGKVLDREELGVVGEGPWGVISNPGNLLAVYEPHRGSTVKPAVVVAPAGAGTG